MSTYSRRRPAALLAGLVPALAASLIPHPLHANDRDLRGTPVPSAACAVGDNNLATPPFAFGGALASGGGALGLSSKTTGAQFLTLFCPLPVNNVDLSGTTNDNDITKIRVHYKDSDGFGTNARIIVQVARGVVSASEPSGVGSILACQWFSPQLTSSPTPTGGTKTTFPCAVDLSNGAFYAFAVRLEVAQSATPGAYQVMFLGFDFPQ